MLKLIIEDDEGHTTVVPLVRDEVFIGRKEGNTIRLTERNVSRRHARLLRQDAAFAVEDLGSYTGVKVNGQRISLATPLKDGDRIQIGDYRLDLRSDEARPTKELPILGSPAAAPNGPNGQGPGPAQGAVPPAVGQVARAPAAVTQPAMPAPSPAQQAGERTPPPVPVNVPGVVAPPAPGPGQTPALAAAAPSVQPPSQGRSPVPRPTGASISGVNQVPPPTSQPDASALQAGAPAFLEGTPTIPLRTLESPPEPATIPEQTGRLVVLNTDLAGHEYSLGRASQVIGRTDENDIVLNHRSISRHHAKILREGTRTSIVDLQSANGVRVNGQDYERVELHPGDVIELGHVKLRHVGPGEEFLFTPGKLGGRIKTVWLAGGAGGAAVLSAVLFLAFHTKSPPAPGANASAEAKIVSLHEHPVAAAPSAPSEEPAVAAVAAGPTVAPTGATRPAIAAPTLAAAGSPGPTPGINGEPHPTAPEAAAGPSSPGSASPTSTLATVNQAIAGERWEDASATLSDLLKRKKDEPGAAWIPEAEALKGRIAEEKKNAAILGEIDEALAQRDGDRALKRIQAIPATSAFKVKALGRQPEAVRLAVKQRLARADADLEKGACDELRAEERAIRKLDPENQEAEAMVRSCRPAHAPVNRPLVAARTTTGRAAPTPAAPGAKTRAADTAQVKDNEEPKQDPSELIRQARDAWLRQQCDSAIDLSKKALKLRPGSPDAYQIIAVCACSQRDAEGAHKAYSKLDERNRSLVRTTCMRNGVHLPE